MKKILILAGLFLAFSSPTFASSFSDVSENHLNYYAIEYLKEHEVIHGYSDGTFKPDEKVNRAEAIKIIDGAFSVDMSGEYDVIFPDVKKEDWFFPYVMGAKSAEIVHGYQDGKFRPENTVNLAETLKLIVLAGKVELPPQVSENVFTDVPKSEWYAPHALYTKEHNVVLPDENGNLNASAEMTRGQIAEVIYRMMVINEKGGEEFPLAMNWKLFSNNFLPFKMKYNDKEWLIDDNGTEVKFYHLDEAKGQFFPNRIYPNTGLVDVSIDENEGNLTKEIYFQQIKDAFSGAEFKEFTWADFSGLEVLNSSFRTVDWYFYLGNRNVLAIFTEYGNGLYGYTLQKTIKAMLSTLIYNADVSIGTPDYTEILAEIFANILVEGKGMSSLNKLPDKNLIETDAIGVGTGPVDYYYSAIVDYTFKYERASDVILDKREGVTTAF